MEEKSNFADRIQEIKRHLNVNTQKLSELLGYKSQEKISRILRNPESTKPSFDLISDMSEKFEWLNTSWLLTGKGKMLLDGEWFANKYREHHNKELELEKILEQRDKEIIELKGIVKYLENQVK